MEKKLIYILSGIAVITVLIGVLVASNVFTLGDQNKGAGILEEEDYNPLDQQEEQSEGEVVSALAASKSEAVVTEFYTRLESGNAEQAFVLLAEEARNLKEDGMTVSDFVENFAGVEQSAPDEAVPEDDEQPADQSELSGMPEQGMGIEGVTKESDNLYEVKTVWSYSDNVNVEKTFLVLAEEDQFLIMAVQ